ncbi:hypothetical protein FOZ63_027789 [Perkinsus olseni]|uniref:Uncharacterized protein n=1 Tax=Perkinsus olseni TaxID=32597 RepID=A0A7J6RTF8_PEROL|nr:hypothetical protein FOZ63_027789 [Perkinsus olseni]
MASGNGDEDDEFDRRIARKYAGNSFMQQRLSAWQPLLSPRWVISSFVSFGMVFLALGAALSTVHSSEYRKDYTTSAVDGVAVIEIAIDTDMEAPIYVYYELSNFYQNHRLFIDSRSDAQLANPTAVRPGADPPAECEPATKSAEGKIYYPCGLVARAVFNDSFLMDVRKRNTSEWRRANLNEEAEVIAWQPDLEHRFQNLLPGAPAAAAAGSSVADARIRNDEIFDMWLTYIFPPQICVPTRAWPDGRYEPVFVMSRLDQRGHHVASCDDYSAEGGGGGGARCRFTKVLHASDLTHSESTMIQLKIFCHRAFSICMFRG